MDPFKGRVLFRRLLAKHWCKWSGESGEEEGERLVYTDTGKIHINIVLTEPQNPHIVAHPRFPIRAWRPPSVATASGSEQWRAHHSAI